MAVSSLLDVALAVNSPGTDEPMADAAEQQIAVQLAAQANIHL